MILRIIYLIVSLMIEFSLNYIMVSAFESKKNRSKFTEAMWFFLLTLPLCLCRFFWNHILVVRYTVLVALIVSCVVYLHVMMKGSLSKKILFIVIQEMVGFIAELIVFLPFQGKFSHAEMSSFDNPTIFTVSIVDGTVVNVVYFIVLMVWKRFMMKEVNVRIKTALMFIAFPISQAIFIIAYEENVMFMSTESYAVIFIGAAIGFLADIALMITLIHQQQMNEMNRHILEMENARNIEAKHYEDIEARRNELAKIRHDLNEQFILLAELNKKGEMERMAEILKRLTDYVALTKEYEYCADPIVNAILAENERLCAERGITLELDIAIYEPLKIDPVTTCSVFSNILRNSIAATERCEEEKKIQLTAALRGDYLHIIEENTYADMPVKSTRRGYGREILGSIAQNQNGTFEWFKEEKKYRMEISIENSNVH